MQSSINYLSLEGLPWVLAAWLGMFLFRPFATFLHELGHTIPALILTRKEVYIRVGQSESSWKGKCGKIFWEFSFVNSKEGFSGYDKTSLKKLPLFIIITGGLFSSLLNSYITGWYIFRSDFSVEIEIILVSWFCANSLIFIRAIIPLRLRPTTAFPEGPPSDGLELIKILSPKND